MVESRSPKPKAVGSSPTFRAHFRHHSLYDMKKIITFIKGSIDEIKDNVSWPSYAELQNSSVLVLVASLVFALVIFGIDFVFEGGMGAIYQSFQSSFDPTVNTPVE